MQSQEMFHTNKPCETLQGFAGSGLTELKEKVLIPSRRTDTTLQADAALLLLSTAPWTAFLLCFPTRAHKCHSHLLTHTKRSEERRQHLQNWTRLEIFLVHSFRLAYFQYFCVTEVLKLALELIQRARLGSECSHYLFFHHLHYLRLTGKRKPVLALAVFLFQNLIWVQGGFLGTEDDQDCVVS